LLTPFSLLLLPVLWVPPAQNKMPTMAQLLAVLSKHIAGLPAAAAGVVASAAVSAAAATAAAASTVNGSTMQVQA
jgi:hypothetical protein